MNATKKTLSIMVRHEIGSIVFQRIVEERYPGIVTGFIIRETAIVYLVRWPDGEENHHQDCELTSEFLPSYES